VAATKEKGSQPTSLDRPDGEVFRVPWLRLARGTAVVLGVGCVGLYLYRRFGGSPAGGGRLEVLEVKALQRKLELYLVRVGDRAILFAVRGDGVRKLAEFQSKELPEPSVKHEEGSEWPFSRLLRRMSAEAN
jgi:flagellar biogenesis protein FliO